LSQSAEDEAPAEPAVNPPPEQAAVAAFVLREVAALLFVFGWLVMYAGELLTGRYVLPFWVHMLGVAVLAYALGLNVASLTAYRPPTPVKTAARAAVKRSLD
jgi:hypothetical protein